MALQPGDKFGRYELVSWLGRGGMAETWRARWMGDAGVTKSVLIKKVLPEFVEDDAFISMFINEARISATLSHGNIAQVFDFGRVEGQYYLAMELVDGQPLHHVLKRAVKTGLQRMPIPLAVYIALEMCRGLHYAHTRTDDKGKPLGIVHRDISPDNVLISYEGQVKIVDFGIAKAEMARNFKTEPGVVKGKYHFFSPEQARGKEVDARTDVWATGLVLYELLCGQRPVTGTQAAVMMRMAHGEFPSPREVRPDLPVELDELVMKALSVNIEARFESANAFADALAQFLYSHAPRFSTMNLAYLVRVLFRGDMAVEGRELSVPTSFIDELTVWRASGAPPEVPAKKELAKEASSRAETEMELDLKPGAQRPTRKLLLATGAVGDAHPTVEALESHRPATNTSTRGGMMGWGAMAAFAAVLVIVVGTFYAYVIAPPRAGGPPPLPLSKLGPRASDAPDSPTPLLVRPEEDPPGATKDDVRHARRLLERGDYQSASAMAEKCLTLVTNHPDCLFIAGASMARMKKFDVAVQRYQSLATNHPGHPLAGVTRTLIEEYERKHAEQVASAPRTTSESAPLDAHDVAIVDEWVTKSRALIKKQKYREAAAMAEQCLKVFPSVSDCHLLMGIAKARLDKVDEGARHYRRFLELAPSDHPARGEVATLLKHYEDSKRGGRY
ncbi:protein kinase [Myxococcus sp. AM011]|uniref:serine/threonine-protein kinase n=1 Tax=Myxococcus sp. AM011 TaxID=2745200 RepID=UPI0015958617|nr:serine/threonine-protein kinase [Myxococcus sp. AM011]NVJ23088.1 protein kinase [Myxococcus sp. AM011]